VDNQDFQECDTCRAKPGTPVLCAGCLHNRSAIENIREAWRANLDRMNSTIEHLRLQINDLERARDRDRAGVKSQRDEHADKWKMFVKLFGELMDDADIKYRDHVRQQFE